jgi:hypothetical protein
VHGHHYALVDVEGLEPGSRTPYTVRLDGAVAWPEPAGGFPPSVIRTYRPGAALKVLFGSCRTAVPHTPGFERSHGVDVLRSMAIELASAAGGDGGDGGDGTGSASAPLPDLLLLLGDQVYADEPSEQVREFIRGRRDVSEPPGEEVVDYAEYACMYQLAWSEPLVRWLLSTVPSAMIFDDHDIRDDWNTSIAWRARMHRQPWWNRRIVAGLGSYWVYQHLGNLSAAERRRDGIYTAVLAASAGGGPDAPADAGAALDEYAERADRVPDSYRWSYHRDLDGTRLVVLDSRAGRVLDPGARSILPARDWDWFGGLAVGGVDHLLIGTSLPYLLPKGLHYLESWDENVADGAWGRWAAKAAEALRQGVDLEHWAAFRRSFERMADTVTEVAAGRRGRAPASVVFLSGDVHYSYLARVTVPSGGAGVSAVYQAVCSPIRNPLSKPLRWANVVASFGLAGFLGRLLALGARTPDTALVWRLTGPPRFDNALGLLDVDGRSSTLRWLSPDPGGGGRALREHDETKLA